MNRRAMLARWAAVAGAVALVAATTGLLGGCANESASGPPHIEFGRDVCDECHMIISEPRFAAAYRDAGGEPFVFDDISDMLANIAGGGQPADDMIWVHDYETEEWLDAPAAWYVSGQIATPMGGGIVAFAHEDEAQAFADEREGEILTWAEVTALDLSSTVHSAP